MTEASQHRGLGLRLICIAAAIIMLFSPILTVGAAWLIRPDLLERAFVAYTDLPYDYFQSAHSEGVRLDSSRFLTLGFRYVQRTAVELVTRTWYWRYHALLMTALLAASALFLGKLPAVRSPGRRELAFAVSAFVISICFSPGLTAPAAALGLTAIYVTSFSPAMNYARARHPAILVALALASGLAHLLCPVVLLVTMAWLIAPRSRKLQTGARMAGRIIALTLCFPAITLLHMSYRSIPLSPGVTRLIEHDQLYDVRIDNVGRRILVTDKLSLYENPCYALNLDDPTAPPWPFLVPTQEAQDIAIDEKGRRIFHVDRGRMSLLIVDADTFEVTKEIFFPDNYPGTGSPEIAFARPHNLVFCAWEDNWLSAINIKTMALNHSLVGQYGNIIYDNTNDMLYLLGRSLRKPVAIDAGTLKQVYENEGPNLGDWALSRKHARLYATTIPGSTIWVYSTPKLEILDHIASRFGVRSVEVDDLNDLLLVMNLFDGKLDVLDMNTHKQIAQYYVGPYCRKIAVDPPNRRAFVTLRRRGLFMIEY